MFITFLRKKNPRLIIGEEIAFLFYFSLRCGCFSSFGNDSDHGK